MVRYHTAEAAGHKIFYREAGDRSAPAVLLLHGFPTSSHMFRNLIPRLAEHYRVVAPDLTGFGVSLAPGHGPLPHRCDDLAAVVARPSQVFGLTDYASYVFHHGAAAAYVLAC